MIGKILNAVDDLREEIIDFLRELIRFDSVTGNEKNIQLFIREHLEGMGLETDMWVPSKEELLRFPQSSLVKVQDREYTDRPNVVGVLKGSGDGRSIILNGHVDVVPVEDPTLWKYDPWSGEIVDDKIFGRGASDMKSGVAASIMAVKALVKVGVRLKGDIIIENVIDEEAGGAGTIACMLKGYTADAAIITEPTSLKIMPANTGAMYLHMRIKGKSAHAAQGYMGVSAIEKACKLYRVIKDFEKDRFKQVSHPLAHEYTLPPCAVTVGIMTAGKWKMTVPENAELYIRIGLMPGEDYHNILNMFKKYITIASLEDSWLRINPPEIQTDIIWEPAETPINSPIVETIKNAYKHALGTDASYGILSAGTDMTKLSTYGKIPSINFGPGDIHVAHTANEYVKIDNLIKATKVLALTLYEWNG